MSPGDRTNFLKTFFASGLSGSFGIWHNVDVRSLLEQGMVQWLERTPPTNVARVQTPASTPYVG